MKILGQFKDYSDNSIKTVASFNKNIIEMTLLQNRQDTDVVCVPTHHFCNLGCKMCHLTNNNLNKEMISIKYNDFIETLNKTLKINNKRITNKKILLISFMGVGEPLLNLELLYKVFLNKDNIAKELNYDKVGFALSTTMPNKESFLELLDFVNINNIPLKIHFSLHSPIDNKRKELIPSSKLKNEEILELLIKYNNIICKNERIIKEYINFHKTNKLVEIHYTLIKDKNDTDEELELLTKLLIKYPITIKFIEFNPINDLEKSNKLAKWKNTLKENNINVKIYNPPGHEIGSSCGEFTKHYYHEELETEEQLEEFLEWDKKHRI